MPRSARYAPGGLIYHALNRAVPRLQLFRKPADYAAFERAIEEAHERVPLDILSYCVMPNHWHFLLRPRKTGELTDFLRWLTHTHTMRWHAHHHTAGNGHLYQGRFKAFPVEEDEHFYSLSQNRRGLAHFAESSEQNVPVPLPRTVLGEAFTPSPATSSETRCGPGWSIGPKLGAGPAYGAERTATSNRGRCWRGGHSRILARGSSWSTRRRRRRSSPPSAPPSTAAAPWEATPGNAASSNDSASNQRFAPAAGHARCRNEKKLRVLYFTSLTHCGHKRSQS